MTTTTFRPFRVSSGEIELQAYAAGPRTAPTLVAAHGIQDQATALEPCLEPLTADFRVVTFDLRGHGDSDAPGVYTLLHYLADLDALLDHLDEPRVVLFGHSLGGQIVSQYAAIHPERVTALVSVEGLGPPARGMAFPRAHQRKRAQQGLRALRRPGEVRSISSLGEAAEHFARTHPRLDPEEARRLAERGTTGHGTELRWKWDPRVLGSLLTLDTTVIERRWGWIECPLLVVTAALAAEFWQSRRNIGPEGATLHPDELQRRLALFAETEPHHVQLEGAGHMAHYDRPEELAQVVASFLADALSSTANAS